MDFVQKLFYFLTGIKPEEPEPPKPVTFIMPPKPVPQPAPKPDPKPEPKPAPVYAPPEPDPIAEALWEIAFEAHAQDEPAEFEAYIRQFLDDEEIIVRIMQARTPGIPLAFEPVPDAEIPVGASKCGGAPDLPASIPYPTMSGWESRWRTYREWTQDGWKWNEAHDDYGETAMQLMLQLDLSEVDDPLGRLPKKGMLYIFWSGEYEDLRRTYRRFQDPKWGGTMELRGDKTAPWQVILYTGDEPLVRTKAPLPYLDKTFDGVLESGRFTPCDAYYDLDPAVFNLDEYGLDHNDAMNWSSDKLFGIPAYLINASEPDDGWQNLFQSSFSAGCIQGIWWYMKGDRLTETLTQEDFCFEMDCD